MKKSERDHIREVFKGCVAILNPQERNELGGMLGVDESQIMRLLDSYERLVEALKGIESLHPHSSSCKGLDECNCGTWEVSYVKRARQVLAEVEK